MREIKLKAWDVVAKKWITKFWLTSNGDLIYPNGGRPIIELKKDCYKLVQYTGLKDVNGIDIYESDIINIFDDKSCNIAQVVFEDGCFSMIGYLGDLRSYPLRGQLFLGKKFKIIGNIYQNPELLEEA